MSLEHTEMVTCPRCNKPNQVNVWQSLNGDLNPDAKQMLLDGILFHFKCQSFYHKCNLNYELLYHDMKHQAMVYYTSLYSIEKTIEMINATEETFRGGMPGYSIRIVTSQGTLREKAMIFESGLDDRIIEIMKLIILTNAQNQYPEAVIEAVFFSSVQGEEIIFELVSSVTLNAKIPFAVYRKLSEDYESRFKHAGNKERIVNSEWAQNFITT